jgi:Fe-S cluster biogenesis protein NfuA
MKRAAVRLDGAVEPTTTDAPTTTAAALDAPFPVTGEHPDAARRVRDLADVIEVIKPVIAADGGSLDVLEANVETGVVRLQLSGACGSCAVSAATLNGGVNRILTDRLSWVTEVIGGVLESDDTGFGGWTPKAHYD